MSWAENNVTRILRCAYSDRHTLGKQLIGYVSGNIMNLPHEYEAADTSETVQNCFCHKIDIVGLGEEQPGIDASTGAYTYAKITAYYSTTEYDTQTLVSESLEPSTNFLTLSTEGLTWQGDGAPLYGTEAPFQMVCLMDWVYTIHQMESIPDAFYALRGCVNQTAVYSRALNKWFEAETLLCNAPVVEREFTNWGVKTFRATFRFTYMYNGVSADTSPAGWNHFPRHTITGGDISWERICDQNANWRYFYPLGNFWDIIA
jgi:hypothetical protein